MKVTSLKRERDQEGLYLKEGSSFRPLRQGSILTAQLHNSREQTWKRSEISKQMLAINDK